MPVFEKMLAYLSNSGKRSRSESQVAARTSFCKNMWGGTDVARETRAAVGIARSLLPLQLWETSTRVVYSSVREDREVRMGHQNVKHAACAALRFGQERPQCDQSALRRFVGDGGAAVAQREGDCKRSRRMTHSPGRDRSQPASHRTP